MGAIIAAAGIGAAGTLGASYLQSSSQGDPMKNQRRFYYQQLYGSQGNNGLLAALMRDRDRFKKHYDSKWINGQIDRYGRGEMAREANNAVASGLGNTTARSVAQRGVGRDVMDMKHAAVMNRDNMIQSFNDRAYNWQLAGAQPAFANQQQAPIDYTGAMGQLSSGLGAAAGQYVYNNGAPGPNNSQAYLNQLLLQQLQGNTGGYGIFGGNLYGGGNQHGFG